MSPTPEQYGDLRADTWDKALGIQTKAPGQNAFARKASDQHKYRLQGNAFYQRKFSEAAQHPPTDIHPAFRPGGPDWDKPVRPYQEMSANAPRPPRDSDITTMSAFIDAGKPVESPPLNLYTTPEHTPQVTQRGFIEEQKEQQEHSRSGSSDERTPVFRPTPKVQSEEFGQPKHSSKKSQEVKFADQQPPLPTKSPKKSKLFGRFFGSAKAAPPPLPTEVPPKAEQILGEKTPRRAKGLGRSPSKQKGLFSRRSSDADALLSPRKGGDEVQERPSTSMGHYSTSSRGSLSKRTGSQLGSDAGTDPQSRITPVIARTQSLKYMDSGIPPTPPSKDTPPDVKAIRDAAKVEAPIIPFDNNTPSRSTGFVSTSKDLSPTRLGSYGYRVGPNLVTKPSMHSMRASVVPNEMDPHAFEDAKQRVEGLGLEGFSMPFETRQTTTYSPSMYSPDWGRRSVATFERIEEQKEEESPSMKMVGGHSFAKSIDTMDTTCTSATIHVGLGTGLHQRAPPYPELVKDSSIVDFMRFGPMPLAELKEDATPKLGVESTPRLDEKIKSTAHLFAAPHDHYADSPMSHHSSAQVSPLHLHTYTLETLPATTYVPPPKANTPSCGGHRKSHSTSIIDSVGSPAPKRGSHDVLENRPLLPKEDSASWKARELMFDTDPTKSPSNMNLTKSLEEMALSGSKHEHWRHDSGVEEPDQPAKKKKKRVSTLHAHEFYRQSPSPELKNTSSSRQSEASTIIQTPNLPVQMTLGRNAEGHYTSRGLSAEPDMSVPPVPHIHTDTAGIKPRGSPDHSSNETGEAAEPATSEPTMAELMALIQQQQSTIQTMMMKMSRMEKK